MKPIQLPLCIRLADDATFANYLPGANAAALAHTCQLAEGRLDLLYLWGKNGSGRSHLLQAACLHAQQAGRQALYLPLAELLQYGADMLEGLEQCELLALDDVQAISTRADWQEALFHLFNRLRDSGACLLLAADSAPRELPLTLADLRSRLCLALIFKLEPLSDQEKLSALGARAAQRGLLLSGEAARFILSRGQRSMGTLFEILDTLDRASLQAQRKLTIPFIKQVLNW